MIFQIRKPVVSLNLTGNIGNTYLHRIPLVEYSFGTQILGHHYEIGNNKECQFKNKLEFRSAYPVLVGNTTLVSGSPFQEQKLHGKNKKRHLDRPVVCKEAKKRKAEAKKIDLGYSKSVQKSAHDILMSIALTKLAMKEKDKRSLEIEKKKLNFQQKNY